jgi:two-component system chemotaxis response regulator CheB
MGASAGGVETLRRVVAGLPADLDAAICVVLHLAPDSPSALPHILERSGSLPCHAARDGEELEPGCILVAPPDRHLVIQDGHVRLTAGPRENGHRPAIDTLFRSAARHGDGHVIGVILSGMRDDGSAGLASIKASGGAAIVQDPEEAMYGAMPRSALASVAVDGVVPSGEVASAVAAMVNGDPLPPGGQSPDDPPAAPEPPSPMPGEPLPDRLTTICPECGGVLTEHHRAGVVQWECRVGHRYSPDSLLTAQAEGVEAAMWAAVRALEDRRILLDRMARQFESREQHISARSVRQRANEAREHAQAVRAALAGAALSSPRELEPGREQDEPEVFDETEMGRAS